jgi:hypothetical protein
MTVMMTTLGKTYSANDLEYPAKDTTRGRMTVPAIAPNGHLIRVTVTAAGSISYCFCSKEHGKLHIPGSLFEEAGRTHFAPRKKEDFDLLYNWDRERSPSDHLPVEVLLYRPHTAIAA